MGRIFLVAVKQDWKKNWKIGRKVDFQVNYYTYTIEIFLSLCIGIKIDFPTLEVDSFYVSLDIEGVFWRSFYVNLVFVSILVFIILDLFPNIVRV